MSGNVRNRLSRSLGLIAVLVALSTGIARTGMTQEGPPGITRPVVFPPFNPNAPDCSRPAGLRKSLTFAQDNSRKFMQGVARGLELAAIERGLTYEIDQANNDPTVIAVARS
jgi:ribose transport system substrate-binding protein